MSLQGSSSLHFYIVKDHYKIIEDINLSSTFYAFEKIDNATNTRQVYNVIRSSKQN